MPTQIMNGSGSQYLMVVNPDGSINIGSLSGNIVIGSVSASVDSVFIQSGANLLGSFGITTNPVPVSGEITIRAGSTQTYNPIGVGSTYETNTPIGYSNFQAVTGSAGSNSANVLVFSAITQSVGIENLGSTPFYFSFDGTSVTSGNTSGFITANASAEFDLKVGSVNILQSGGLATPTQVQVFRLS